MKNLPNLGEIAVAVIMFFIWWAIAVAPYLGR